jgi:hypothetical protein
MVYLSETSISPLWGWCPHDLVTPARLHLLKVPFHKHCHTRDQASSMETFGEQTHLNHSNRWKVEQEPWPQHLCPNEANCATLTRMQTMPESKLGLRGANRQTSFLDNKTWWDDESQWELIHLRSDGFIQDAFKYQSPICISKYPVHSETLCWVKKKSEKTPACCLIPFIGYF